MCTMQLYSELEIVETHHRSPLIVSPSLCTFSQFLSHTFIPSISLCFALPDFSEAREGICICIYNKNALNVLNILRH